MCLCIYAFVRKSSKKGNSHIVRYTFVFLMHEYKFAVKRNKVGIMRNK